jgi:hypothetical protein
LWATALALLAFAVVGVFEPPEFQTPLHNQLIVWAWLLSLVCFSASVLHLAGWTLPRPAGLLAGLRAHRLEAAGVLALGLVALALRTYLLTEHPYAFIHDEGSMGLEALSLLNGARSDLFGVGGSSNPMWTFLPLRCR